MTKENILSKIESNKNTWSDLLKEAVNKPGRFYEGYSTFYNYSVGNQIFACIQQQPDEGHYGPIATYKKWQELGRHVKKGAKAIALLVPNTHKVEKEDTITGEIKEYFYNTYYIKRQWFFLSDTEGADYTPEPLKEWNKEKALKTLNIEEIPFTMTNGNIGGYATERKIAINPLNKKQQNTIFHEMAHVVLGHTTEQNNLMQDNETTPRNIKEVEAESVALICAECLQVPGAEYSRSYIQGWLGSGDISEKSAQKIFKAADTILKAGIE